MTHSTRFFFARHAASAGLIALAALSLLFSLLTVNPALAQYDESRESHHQYNRDRDSHDRYREHSERRDDRYRDERRDDDQDYNDGSYASDQRGYADDDDEDGYEDGQDAPDVAYFYNELEDEGAWIESHEYGHVWRPRHIDTDWRPYTRGTWANTREHGWYWVSDEPFGWATYHYGRWYRDEDAGWVWVPGTRWGPAWVAWRSNDQHIGWAPLPPEAHWEHGHGLHVSANIYEGPRYASYWSFVEPQYITTPRVYTYCAPPTQVVTIINVTRPQTNYIFVDRRIVNRGVPVANIERVTRTQIRTVRVNASDNRAYRAQGVAANQVVNQQVNVFRPKLTRAQPRAFPPGKPNPNRAQWHDVDQRPLRPARGLGAVPRQAGPGVPRNQPFAGPAGGPNRAFRANPGNPNAGNPHAGNWGAHQVQPAVDPRIPRQERIRAFNQQRRINAAAQGGQPPPGRSAGQVINQAQGVPQGNPNAAAARRRQLLLQQQRRNQNQ